jgi:hypothetical protein
MQSSTATKIVAAFAIGGIGFSLWFGKTGQDRYRKVWGVMLLSAVGAMLADFAPPVVGPFFGLIIVAYLIGHQSSIASVVTSVKNQATGPQTPPTQKG